MRTFKTGLLFAIISLNYFAVAQQVSVSKFGANGNDDFDDTKAIQTGIDYLSKKGGGILYFPKGTYMISNQKVPGKSISVNLASNIQLIGDGIGKSILKLLPLQPGFTRILLADNIKNITLKKLTFNGNYTSQKNPTRPSEHLHGIFIDQSANVSIDNCEFINTGGDGICIRGVAKSSSNINISNCIFNGNRRNGITLGSGFRAINISKCYFGKRIGHSPIDTEPTGGICGDVLIENNLIETNNLLTLGGVSKTNLGFNQVLRNNTLTSCSIFIIYGSKITIENNKITGSTKKAAITIFRKNENIMISGNVIKSNHQRILDITYSANQYPNDIKIFNNEIEFNSSSRSCFNIRGADNIHIKNNKIKSNSNANIFMDISATRSMQGLSFVKNEIGYFKKNFNVSFIKNNTIDGLNITGNIFGNNNFIFSNKSNKNRFLNSNLSNK